MKKLRDSPSPGGGSGVGGGVGGSVGGSVGGGVGGGVGIRERSRRGTYHHSLSPQPPMLGLNKSGSLKRSGNFASHSVRF